jgi:hypothetical protein
MRSYVGELMYYRFKTAKIDGKFSRDMIRYNFVRAEVVAEFMTFWCQSAGHTGSFLLCILTIR